MPVARGMATAAAVVAILIVAAATAVDGRVRRRKSPASLGRAGRSSGGGTVHISKFAVRSDIKFRYAKTAVESHVENFGTSPASHVFKVVVPKHALISGFSIKAGGQEYKANVQDKDQARQTYSVASPSGQSAGLVAQKERDAQFFEVQANIDPNSTAIIRLNYEEMLVRKNGYYEHIIHTSPGEIVKDFTMDVYIDESLPVKNPFVPKFKTNANDVTSDQMEQNAKIVHDPNDKKKAHISYSPGYDFQDNASPEGLIGQLIVRYDVDRTGVTSDIQVTDGYFVHFFAPVTLPTIPKHIVFVLDISGSMYGRKLEQTKDAMATILNRGLAAHDYFNIFTFHTDLMHWDHGGGATSEGNKDNRREAMQHVLQLTSGGGTDINKAILGALDKVQQVQNSNVFQGNNVKPIIVFMTDGKPESGETNGGRIRTNIRSRNQQTGDVPIHGLAFGNDADFNLIKDISTENNAFAQKIFEASDAAVQLEDFYDQISRPQLMGVNFNYGSGARSLTRLPTGSVLTEGKEIMVLGRVDQGAGDPQVTITGEGKDGAFNEQLTICRSTECGQSSGPMARQSQSGKNESNIERAWAMKTIRDLSEDALEKGDASAKQKIVELATKYNFVTPLTSLVVEKPGGGGEISDPTEIKATGDQGGESGQGGGATVSCTGCCIALYDKTYQRGESVTISDRDEPDLSSQSFEDDALMSLEVVGSCCWTVYSEKNFAGKSKVFRTGKTPNVEALGQVLSNAASVKKQAYC